jgi:hypothetical protein
VIDAKDASVGKKGGIAIDDVSFTPGCVLLSDAEVEQIMSATTVFVPDNDRTSMTSVISICLNHLNLIFYF